MQKMTPAQAIHAMHLRSAMALPENERAALRDFAETTTRTPEIVDLFNRRLVVAVVREVMGPRVFVLTAAGQDLRAALRAAAK